MEGGNCLGKLGVCFSAGKPGWGGGGGGEKNFGGRGGAGTSEWRNVISTVLVQTHAEVTLQESEKLYSILTIWLLTCRTRYLCMYPSCSCSLNSLSGKERGGGGGGEDVES